MSKDRETVWIKITPELQELIDHYGWDDLKTFLEAHMGKQLEDEWKRIFDEVYGSEP